MAEAFTKRDYSYLSVPYFYFYQQTLYVEGIWHVELDNQDLFYLFSSESFDTLDVQIESIFYLPLHIIGPMRYGAKLAHKCIPESSGLEQI